MGLNIKHTQAQEEVNLDNLIRDPGIRKSIYEYDPYDKEKSIEHTCNRVLGSPRIMIFLGDNVKVINVGFKLFSSMNIVTG